MKLWLHSRINDSIKYISKKLEISSFKVVATFNLRLGNEFKPIPDKNQASDWLIRQVKWLESQIKGDHNFSLHWLALAHYFNCARTNFSKSLPHFNLLMHQCETWVYHCAADSIWGGCDNQLETRAKISLLILILSLWMATNKDDWDPPREASTFDTTREGEQKKIRLNLKLMFCNFFIVS